MTDGASPLLSVVLMGGAFGGFFFLFLFMLWASGRSPLVRIAGELAGALLYLVMALAQAWNSRGTQEATFWKFGAAAMVLAAALNMFRFAKIYRQKLGASAPTGRRSHDI